MIEIKNLSKRFGKKEVIKNLSLTIQENSIFGLVGINGAGKSTLLRILAGVYHLDEGDIFYDGKNFLDIHTKKDIFLLPDDPYIENNETVQSFFSYYEAFYHLDKGKFLEYLALFQLDKSTSDTLMQQKISKFSKGMKRQLFICLALAIAPKYLFLDEAFDGLDPLARLTFKRIVLKRMEEKTMTVIISSHSLRELEDICDNFGLLDGGNILNSGNIEEEKTQYHKYQLAFEVEIKKKRFIELFQQHLVSYHVIGHVVVIIVSLEEDDEIMNKLHSLHPLLIDKLNIDFEELFIIEVESKGYLKNETK